MANKSENAQATQKSYAQIAGKDKNNKLALAWAEPDISEAETYTRTVSTHIGTFGPQRTTTDKIVAALKRDG